MLIALALLASLVLYIGNISAIVSYSYEETDTEFIVALRNNSSVTGSFFLGTGSIKDKLIYTYMVQEDRGLLMKQIPATRTFIVEGTGHPRIERVYTVSKLWWHVRRIKDVIIYIPEGSVYQGYSVDIRNN